MAIYKSKTVSKFTIIPNDVFKSGMSLEAIGLLSYFLSLPEDWVIYKTMLHNHLDIGREKLDRVFKELQASGYIISVERRTSGKISYEHIVYDKPFNGEPLTEKPYTGFTSTADTPLQSTKEQSTELPNTKDKSLYQLAVDFWLNEFHSGWNFKAVHGKKMKSILEDLRRRLKSSGKDCEDSDVLDAFKKFCLNLPPFYQDKDLSILESKMNEIIEEIKKKKDTEQKKANNPRPFVP